MKKGEYKTPEGEILNVLEFDAENKMAYVHIQSGQHKWYTEDEYSTWVSNDTAAVKQESKGIDTDEDTISVTPKKKKK